jgi:hypothetical protein
MTEIYKFPLHNEAYLEAIVIFKDVIPDTNCIMISGGKTPVLFKLKDLWTYLSTSFVDSDKYLK